MQLFQVIIGCIMMNLLSMTALYAVFYGEDTNDKLFFTICLLAGTLILFGTVSIWAVTTFISKVKRRKKNE